MSDSNLDYKPIKCLKRQPINNRGIYEQFLIKNTN